MRQKQENYTQLITTSQSIFAIPTLRAIPSKAFTQKFMRDRDDKTLQNLLIMMRQDLGLPRTPRNVTIVGKELSSSEI